MESCKIKSWSFRWLLWSCVVQPSWNQYLDCRTFHMTKDRTFLETLKSSRWTWLILKGKTIYVTELRGLVIFYIKIQITWSWGGISKTVYCSYPESNIIRCLEKVNFQSSSTEQIRYQPMVRVSLQSVMKSDPASPQLKLIFFGYGSEVQIR